MTLQGFGSRSRQESSKEAAGRPAIDSPAIDIGALMSRCLGDASFADILLKEIESTGQQQVDAINHFVKAGDLKNAAEKLHALKGAAAIIGANALSATASDAETAGHDGKTEELSEMVQCLRAEMTRCLSYIQRRRGETGQCE